MERLRCTPVTQSFMSCCAGSGSFQQCPTTSLLFPAVIALSVYCVVSAPAHFVFQKFHQAGILSLSSFLKKKNPYLRVWLLIFREKGRGWGERTKHQSVASCYAPRQLMEPCRLGVCPDRGSNPEPFRAQHSAPTTRAAGQGVTHS